MAMIRILIYTCLVICVSSNSYRDAFKDTPAEHDQLLKKIRSMIFGNGGLVTDETQGLAHLDSRTTSHSVPTGAQSYSSGQSSAVTSASHAQTNVFQTQASVSNFGSGVLKGAGGESNKVGPGASQVRPTQGISLLQSLRDQGVHKILQSSQPVPQNNGQAISKSQLSSASHSEPLGSVNKEAKVNRAGSGVSQGGPSQDSLLQTLRNLGVHKLVSSPQSVPQNTVKSVVSPQQSSVSNFQQQSFSRPVLNQFITGQSPSVSHQAFSGTSNLQTNRVSSGSFRPVAAPFIPFPPSSIPQSPATSQQAASNGVKVTKSVFIHVAPDMPAPPPIQILAPKTPKKKHYNVVLVKTPTVKLPEILLPEITNRNEEKTLVYVLQQNPVAPKVPVLKINNEIKSEKPGVFLIKYDGDSSSSTGGNSGASGQVAASLGNFGLSGTTSQLSSGQLGNFNLASLVSPLQSQTIQNGFGQFGSQSGSGGAFSSVNRPATLTSLQGFQGNQFHSGFQSSLVSGGQGAQFSSSQHGIVQGNLRSHGSQQASPQTYANYPRTQRRTFDERKRFLRTFSEETKTKLYDALFGPASKVSGSKTLEISKSTEIVKQQGSDKPKKMAVVLKKVRPIENVKQSDSDQKSSSDGKTADIIVSGIKGGSGMGVVPDIASLMSDDKKPEASKKEVTKVSKILKRQSPRRLTAWRNFRRFSTE